jgi:FdhD protein
MVTEGIVTHPRDIRSIRHCDIVDDQAAEGNTIMAVVRSSLELDVSALRRNLYTSSSCGICGKASIAAAMKVAPALTGSWVIDLQCVASLPDRLRTHQHAFSQTGGLHAAGLFTAQGVCKWVREDVGRHNAVDKVIGAAWDVGADLTAMALVVSGRVSFEIVQKALSARIPVIVAVSAPSSLAIELASGAGIGLAAFVRDGRVAIFATPRRFRGP